MNAVQRLQKMSRDYGVPHSWTPPVMPNASEIKPEMFKKEKAGQFLDQVRSFVIDNPNAQSLAGAGLGYLGSQAASAAVNTLMPFDVDVDPNFVSGMGTMAGGLLGGPMIARALARRSQA